MKRRKALLLPLAGGAARLLAQGPKAAGGKQDGSVMARVKVEIFSDFQCPGCKQLHETAIRQLHQDYGAAGRILIVHREFPLPFHKYARQAALLACAADRIGKYAAVSDALFRDQQLWAESGKLDDTLRKTLSAGELAKVKTLAGDPAVAAQVDADMAAGKLLMKQIQTPTMVFTRDGKSQPVAGVISYAILRRYVDTLLAQ